MRKRIGLGFMLVMMAFSLKVMAAPVHLKSVRIRRAASEIKVDGRLDEQDWLIAETATGFHQRFPADTSPALSQTEIRLTYDEKNLYIAAICHDEVDGRYVVTSLRRDYERRGNDALNIIIDPFSDLTNAFLFGITPYGAQRESQIRNGGAGRHDENDSWDNKWFTRVSREEGRWILEAAIPFKTLRFKEGVEHWRINFIRYDYKRNEYSNWNWIPRNFPSTSLAHTGELVWDEPLDFSRANISLIPYASIGHARNYEEGNTKNWPRGLGSDAKVGIGSSLNLDLTVNPDFSQVEVDEQVTDLDRFEIFYPEKRQFFIENSDLFAEFGHESVRPFFSRRIGIAEDTASGENVENPIYFGARLSGRLNRDWRVGLMNMQTADDRDIGLPSTNYSVAALQRRVFSRSNIAGLFVNKQPSPLLSPEADSMQLLGWNRVGGLEYNLASNDSRWLGKAYYHHSFSPEQNGGSGPGAFAHGSTLMYSDTHWEIIWLHQIVGEDFNAETGYVRRTGYRFVSPSIEYSFYPESRLINRHSPTLLYERLWGKDNTKLDESIGLRYMFRLTNQMSIFASLSRDYVKLTRDYDPSRSGGPKLPERTDYTTHRAFLYVRTDIRKALSGRIRANAGEYYNGNRFGMEADLDYRFRPYGAISLLYAFNAVRLPDPYHDANHHLLGPRIDITFTNNIYFATLVQYNSQKNNINLNARFQWRYQPASDIYLVYTDNYLADIFESRNRALIFKITYWLNI